MLNPNQNYLKLKKERRRQIGNVPRSTKKETDGGNHRSPVIRLKTVTIKNKTMNNYTNPISLIKEEFSEATTISQKSLVIFLSLWALMLSTLAVTGISAIVYELITSPSTFNNATWGIFDTLG